MQMSKWFGQEEAFECHNEESEMLLITMQPVCRAVKSKVKSWASVVLAFSSTLSFFFFFHNPFQTFSAHCCKP